MVSILGTDMDGFFGAIQGGIKDLLGSVSGTFSQGGDGGKRPGFTGAPAADPFAQLNYGQGDDPFAGLSFGTGQDWGAASAQQGLFGLAAGARWAVEAKKAEKAAAARPPATGSTGTGGGPSTGMSPGVAKWAGQAQQVFGGLVDPDIMLAIMQNESGGDPNAYNKAGDAWGLFQQLHLGSNDPNVQFAAAKQLAQEKLTGINAAYAKNGLNPDERTRALDFALAWAGHFDYATGRQNPGSVDNLVGGQTSQQFASIFLGNYDKIKAGRQAPQGGRYTGGSPGLASITGGSGSIGQEFGDTDYSATSGSLYDYGAAYGVHGHTGIDWAVPPGTQVYMPAGLSGTVITSGGTAFFRDEDENPAAVSPAGQGELKIQMSDGTQLILGHMRNISVPVGTQLTAGQLVGLAGSANGGHVHVEVRVPDKSMPSGYRIVDPRQYLAGPTGGGGTQYR